jgi:hypothetical protein
VTSRLGTGKPLTFFYSVKQLTDNAEEEPGCLPEDDVCVGDEYLAGDGHLPRLIPPVQVDKNQR